MVRYKYILSLLLCFAQFSVYAQDGAVFCWNNSYTGTDVDAIIETNTHLITLTKIENHRECLRTKWIVKNKKENLFFYIDNQQIILNDQRTQGKIHPIWPKSPISLFQSEAYQTDSFNINFPALNDTIPIFSINLSPTMSVDSITLLYDSIPQILKRYLKEVRYSVPFAKNQLHTRGDSIFISDSLFKQGMHLYKKKAYKEAIVYFEKCFAFDKLFCHNSLSNRDRSDYSRIWLACSYYKSGQEEKAKLLDGDYMLEPFDRKHTEKADSIYNTFYPFLSDNRAIDRFRKICEYDSITLGTNSHRYALSLYDLGKAYSSKRQYSDAKINLLRSYEIISKLSDKNWLGKSALRELAKIEYEKENYLSAIQYMELCLGIKNIIKIDFASDFPLLSDFATLSRYYSKVGMWDKAIQIEKDRINYWKLQFKKNPLEKFSYISAVNSYVDILRNSGRYKNALRACCKLKEIDVDSWHFWQEMAQCYYNLRDFGNAINCYHAALNKRPPYIPSYISLNLLAICYLELGNINKAILTQRECISKANPRLFDSKYYNGHNLYSDMASFLNENEQYDSALVYEKKSLELKEKYFSLHHEKIAYSHMNLGIAYGGKGNWDEAICHLNYSYDIYKNQRSRFHQRVLSYLSKYSFYLNEIGNLNRYIAEYMISASNDLLSSFQELTYDERSRYIEDYSNLLNREIPTYAYYTHSDSIIEAAYNASLMMKGALLNSENNVKRVIEESKNDALKDLWAELKADRYILAKSLEKDSLYRKLNTDSLQKVIYRLEDSLVVKCKEYGDITRSMKLKWKDIQKHLHQEDLAIEFLSFPANNDSIVYAALLLRKDSKSPKMITLFEEKQLTGFPDSLHYQCKEMTDLVWKPLQGEFEGIKNIYFSPSGALYNIGIEYLPGMENYNVYRLSSTRELVTFNNIEAKNRAVLYGGLRYDAGFDKSGTEKSHAILDEAFKERANVRGMGLRGGKEYLKHTKEEVDIIGEELSKVNWECVIDSAAMGTEESFKALSGREIACLHISTHGFYYTQEDADNARYKFMLIDNNMVSAEDKALTRSGLVMSGANHILEDEELPDNVEDGILTAKEIADVDLHGLDLVVLSACQTGLGDIAQGEGVFGLQRGFKKAGANSILMSLWEVDDKATQIMMTQFYRNLLSGQSKRQSLLNAQKNLREYRNANGEQCYNSPKYWAAFILLDAKDN